MIERSGHYGTFLGDGQPDCPLVADTHVRIREHLPENPWCGENPETDNRSAESETNVYPDLLTQVHIPAGSPHPLVAGWLVGTKRWPRYAASKRSKTGTPRATRASRWWSPPESDRCGASVVGFPVLPDRAPAQYVKDQAVSRDLDRVLPIEPRPTRTRPNGALGSRLVTQDAGGYRQPDETHPRSNA